MLEKELAYLQNPTTAEPPDRSWARHDSVSPRVKRYASVAWLRSFVLLMACLVVTIGWVFWPSAGERNPTEPVVDNAPIVHTNSAPVLWDTDGTAEFADRLRQLSEEIRHSSEAPKAPDAWDQKVGEIRRRLTSLGESESW